VTEGTETLPPDLAAMWMRVRSGHREGHYYAVLVGLKRYDTRHVIAQIQRGFAFSAFERFQKNSALSQQLLADVVKIPERTLARRKVAGRLDPEESDRLLRTSRIFARAVELFEGDAKAAVSWLVSPSKALGGESPLQFAKTDVGASEVEHLIGRLEHGIPS